MHTRTLFLLAALMFCPALHAQELPPFCTSPLISGPGGGSGHLTFSPADPDSAHAVTITTGRHVFVPSSISADVQDHVIDVYVTGHSDGFDPPRGDSCLSASLPPLAAGTYAVNVYSINSEIPGDAPQLFLSGNLSVTGGVQQPVPAPTVSLEALGALGSLLAMVAFFALRRRVGRPERADRPGA